MTDIRAPAGQANPSNGAAAGPGADSAAAAPLSATTATEATTATSATTTASPATIGQLKQQQQQQEPLATLGRLGHELPFVAPSSYLRPRPCRTMTEQLFGPLDKDQMQGLRGIREFLKSLGILIQNGIVSAPLWDSRASTFAGLLTSTDFINVIQYYCQFPDEMDQVDQFRLSSLREIEKAIGVAPLETVSVHPTRPLYEACRRMLKTRARRIPLVDKDEETGRETVVSVITQYRILKFIAVNNEKHTMLLKKSVGEIGLGTYANLATCNMMNPVLEAIHVMVRENISAVPIVDDENHLLNVFEAVDVIPCIKGGAYDELESSIGDALSKRPDDFAGIYTCCEDDRLESIFETIRKSRVHRLVVIDDESCLKGIISLSDILKYVLLYGEEDDVI
ncbi:hypothetical protein P8C59_001665 [Phyllachora maydis]|uniref:CBS domain-containing protein n=1 Tax=Phyllachora maydis TaxID=1825666 RepID=A0AAD9MCI1_9PEZI|nr:hypothetical protein P8C59_001665 [Phyllachora maydis]